MVTLKFSQIEEKKINLKLISSIFLLFSKGPPGSPGPKGDSGTITINY